jgi:hypothetical protein
MEDDDGSREAVEIAQQQDAVRWFLDECILETTAVPDDCDGVAVCFDALAEMYVDRNVVRLAVVCPYRSLLCRCSLYEIISF